MCTRVALDPFVFGVAVMNINHTLCQICSGAKAFASGVSVLIGVQLLILTTLAILTDFLAYNGGSSNFDNRKTFHVRRPFFSIDLKVTLHDDLDLTGFPLIIYFSMFACGSGCTCEVVQ